MGRRKARRNKRMHRTPRPNTVVESCTSRGGSPKIKFNSRAEAEAEVRYYEALFRRPGRVYKCDMCRGWHTTSQKRNR